MGTFNIDFNQFKPSSKGGMAVPSTPTPLPNTLIKRSPAPVVNSIPTPTTQPTGQPAPTPTTAASSKGKIFSGGIVPKILDTLSLPYYALAGFAKSGREEIKRQQAAGINPSSIKAQLERKPAQWKGIVEGVKNRAGFGSQTEDYNLGNDLTTQTGLPQNPKLEAGINFTGSLMAPTLVDVPGVKPLLGMAGKAVAKVAGKAADVARTSPKIAKAVETFVPYFRNPAAGKIITEAEKTANLRINDLYKELETLSKGLTREDQILVGKIIETKATGASPRLTAIAKRVQDLGAKIGQESVDVGVLGQKSFEKSKGRYLPHIFEKYIDNMRQFYSKRAGKKGYLPEFAPSTFYGLGSEIKSIEKVKMFKEMAAQFGKKISNKAKIPEGFVWAKDILPTKNPAVTKAFARTIVPNEIADYMRQLSEIRDPTIWDKLSNVWKEAKTIWNPAYHSRNIMSNQILTGMQTGKGTVPTLVDTFKSLKMFRGGGEQKFVNAAQEGGLIKRVNLQIGFDELRNAMDLSAKKGKLSSIRQGLQNFQTTSEEVSKLTVFKTVIEDIAQRMGTSVDNVLKDKNFVKQAVNKAEEAIFSPYRIGRQERAAASRLVPFYSFARQALPFTAKTAVEHPQRLLKYERTKQAIEGMNPNNVPIDQRTEPYKQQIQLPGQDKNGKDRFFDPTYIYPWGNVDQSSSLPFGLSINPISIGSTPLGGEAIQQIFNYDPYYKQPIADSNIPRRAAGQRISHAFNTVEPTFLANILNKVVPAFQGKPDKYKRERSIIQSLLDTGLGLKTTAVQPGSMQESNAKKDMSKLRSLQAEERDILSDPTLTDLEKNKLLQELRKQLQ